MLEIRAYTKPELAALLGTKTVDNLKKKLNRYNVEYDISGRGEKAVFDIKKINEPFKVFCITELGFDANTEFIKLAYFLYYYFNDDEFMAMPTEAKQPMMAGFGKPISRQTISTYIRKLETNELINRYTTNYIYYFAHKQTYINTDKETYKKAWAAYWQCIGEGAETWMAMVIVRNMYGGKPRKQPIPDTNAFNMDKINYMLDLATAVIEKDVESKSNQSINTVYI